MLAKIPSKYLNDPAYQPFLIEGGFITCELTRENEEFIQLYRKIVDPTNYSISWNDYFLFCHLDDYNDWGKGQEIILHIRECEAQYRDDVSKREREESKVLHSQDERIKRI